MSQFVAFGDDSVRCGHTAGHQVVQTMHVVCSW